MLSSALLSTGACLAGLGMVLDSLIGKSSLCWKSHTAALQAEQVPCALSVVSPET